MLGWCPMTSATQLRLFVYGLPSYRGEFPGLVNKSFLWGEIRLSSIGNCTMKYKVINLISIGRPTMIYNDKLLGGRV